MFVLTSIITKILFTSQIKFLSPIFILFRQFSNYSYKISKFYGTRLLIKGWAESIVWKVDNPMGSFTRVFYHQRQTKI